MKPALVLVLAACGTTGDTRVHVEVADSSIVLDHYQILVGDAAVVAQPLATIEVEVPNELAGSAQTLDVWGLDAGQQIAFGTTSVTPVLHGTVIAEVMLAAASCGSACNVGDTECASAGTSTCQLVGSCLAFGPPTACDSGDVCTAGACGAPPSCEQDGSACDDGNPCTIDDTCASSVCTGTPKCTTAPANAVPTCSADGTCDFTCNAGFMRSGSTCVAPEKQIFITSKTWTASLGGLAGADAKCQTAATAVGLTGTFKAWLSDVSTSASARLSHSTGPYVLVDGTVVAASWTVLTSGAIAHPIDVTETGVVLLASDGAETWTETLADGSSEAGGMDDACDAWTSGVDSSDIVAVGDPNANNANWTDSDVNTCDSENSLYCVEQ